MMGRPRRVAITGLGLVTPLGNDVAATWHALLAGKSGVAPITHFDASGFQVRILCVTSGRPPARCITLAKLYFSRLPLPAARMTMARSLLDMVWSPFCASSG